MSGCCQGGDCGVRLVLCAQVLLSHPPEGCRGVFNTSLASQRLPVAQWWKIRFALWLQLTSRWIVRIGKKGSKWVGNGQWGGKKFFASGCDVLWAWQSEDPWPWIYTKAFPPWLCSRLRPLSPFARWDEVQRRGVTEPSHRLHCSR